MEADEIKNYIGKRVREKFAGSIGTLESLDLEKAKLNSPPILPSNSP